jgi:hypothetical protein
LTEIKKGAQLNMGIGLAYSMALLAEIFNEDVRLLAWLGRYGWHYKHTDRLYI